MISLNISSTFNDSVTRSICLKFFEASFFAGSDWREWLAQACDYFFYNLTGFLLFILIISFLVIAFVEMTPLSAMLTSGDPEINNVLLILFIGLQLIGFMFLHKNWHVLKTNWQTLKQAKIFPWNLNASRLFKNTGYFFFSAVNYFPTVFLPLYLSCLKNRSLVGLLTLMISSHFLGEMLSGAVNCVIFDKSVIGAAELACEKGQFADFLFWENLSEEKKLWLENLSIALETYRNFGTPVPDHLLGYVEDEIEKEILENFCHTKGEPIVVTSWGAVSLDRAILALFLIILLAKSLDGF